MKICKLIYDKYQNDIGITYLKEQNNYNKYEILEKVNNMIINKNRNLEIYTWGLKKNKPVECDIAFDVSLFSGKTNEVNSNYKKLTGLDKSIQQSILNHNLFDILMEKVLLEIEENEPKKIGFFCNYGKHRSVGWAELLHNFYYKNAKLKHLGLKKDT
tara:strand:+ start:675 stop:1148 length:474 start_codon:yes stop_codon:yes gene_type:complete